MKLSRKKAIALCIELWEWCAETGKAKDKWPNWKNFSFSFCERADSYCWFCVYDAHFDDDCRRCPLQIKFGGCENTYFRNWNYATTPRTRKKYAKLFLQQIKSIEGSKRE